MKNKTKMLELLIMTVNRLDYLSKLIDSIKQSYSRLDEKDKQLLRITVSSNGSTDQTNDYLKQLSNDFDYFEIICREETVTAAEHIGLAISECESDYLWIMGDDDLLEPDCLVNVINEIRSNAASTSLFLLNFKQVDRDGTTVIKHKISNISNNWSGVLNSQSELGNGDFNGIFDMLFFVGSVIFKRDIVTIKPGDLDGSTDWDHLPVYLRSFVGQNTKVISKNNIIQRQRNHKAKAENPKENSYRNKDVTGIKALINKLIAVHNINKDSTLIYAMNAPFILHEPVYYDFIDFLKLVCHTGTIEKLNDSSRAPEVFENLYFLAKNLPRAKDQVSVISYLRDLEELHATNQLIIKKKNNTFEKLRLGGRECLPAH